MMAAICAARRGTAVTLLESDERLGKKLNITGKGRCNVTNDAGCEEKCCKRYANGQFLLRFLRFDGRNVSTFFERLGVPLQVSRRRVFRCRTARSTHVRRALERELRRICASRLCVTARCAC